MDHERDSRRSSRRSRPPDGRASDGYSPAPITRRQLVGRAAVAGSVLAGGAWLSFAPEHLPGSRRDGTGLRGLPVPEPFTLPDFSVARPMGAGEVGLGRGATVGERLAGALDAVGGLRRLIAPGDVVLVKPNVAFDRSPNLGATTDPGLLELLIRMLLVDARAAEVRVADNPIESPADCFAKSGIAEAADRAGGRVYLPDSNAFEDLRTPGATLIEQWPFFKRPFRRVNKVIGVAAVKDHNLCHASLGIKNWYGLLGGRRNQFHQDIHEIVSDLSIMIRPTLTILDGSRILMANGPTGGDPANVKAGDVILAATDAVAMDAWAYEHLLERRGELPRYLQLAERKGSGRVDYRGRVKSIG
ncbi:MAG: DUF362 domain-containing protein [Gammaproteobacteria bacterium]|nr:DUF362 domain-containing protein [Gammaproteobacteria bacterium]